MGSLTYINLRRQLPIRNLLLLFILGAFLLAGNALAAVDAVSDKITISSSGEPFLVDVLANDLNPDGRPLQASVGAQSSAVTIVEVAEGLLEVRLSSDAADSGDESLQITVTDGSSSDVSTLRVCWAPSLQQSLCDNTSSSPWNNGICEPSDDWCVYVDGVLRHDGLLAGTIPLDFGTKDEGNYSSAEVDVRWVGQGTGTFAAGAGWNGSVTLLDRASGAVFTNQTLSSGTSAQLRIRVIHETVDAHRQSTLESVSADTKNTVTTFDIRSSVTTASNQRNNGVCEMGDGWCFYLNGQLVADAYYAEWPLDFGEKPEGTVSTAEIELRYMDTGSLSVDQASGWDELVQIIDLATGEPLDLTSIDSGESVRLELRYTHDASFTTRQVQLNQSFIGAVLRMNLSGSAENPSTRHNGVCEMGDGWCFYLNGQLVADAYYAEWPLDFGEKPEGTVSTAEIELRYMDTGSLSVDQSSGWDELVQIINPATGEPLNLTSIDSGESVRLELRYIHDVALTTRQVQLNQSFIGAVLRMNLSGSAELTGIIGNGICESIDRWCVYVDDVLVTDGPGGAIPVDFGMTPRGTTSTADIEVRWVASGTGVFEPGLEWGGLVTLVDATTGEAAERIALEMRESSHLQLNLTNDRGATRTTSLSDVAGSTDVATFQISSAFPVPIFVGDIQIIVPVGR